MTQAVPPDVPAAAPAYQHPDYPGYRTYPDYSPYPGYPVPEPGRFARFITRLYTRAPGWLAPAAVLGCFASATAFVLYTDPTDTAADTAPTCLVKLTTGFDCPGCGGTRAFYYALHGNLPAAARHHAVFIFAVPFLVYQYLVWAGERVFGRRLPPLRITPTMVGVFLAAWGVFTVLRNLPWTPFTWLYV